MTNTITRMRVDVDAGAPRRLGVAADREDVAAEAGARGDVAEEHGTNPTRISAASGTPRSELSTATATMIATATSPIRSTTRPSGGAGKPGRHPALPRPQRRRRRTAPIATSADDPAHRVAVERAGQADDLRVGEVDRAGLAQHLELGALPGEQAGQRDDERRDHEAGEQSSPGTARSPRPRRRPRRSRGTGDQPCLTFSTAMIDGAQAAHGADREVDLAEQQHEHDPDRDQAHRA